MCLKVLSFEAMCSKWFLNARLVALLLSFIVCISITPLIIKYAAKHKLAHAIRTNGPATHLKKFGTPNMGGIAIVISIIFATCLFCSFSSAQYLSILVALFGFAALGLYDDIKKIYGVKRIGLSAKQKITLQIFISCVCCLILRYCSQGYTTLCNLPFSNYPLDLGHFYEVFCILVICGASNSVNLTDGLDGLAIVPICITAASFICLALWGTSNQYQDLIVVCLSIIGSGLGF